MAIENPKLERWTEARVYGLLEKRFAAPEYAILPQVRNGTGHIRKTVRTADALAMSLWPSRGLYLIGLEIKCSTSDLKQELRDPRKSESIQQFCKYWYIVAPSGIADENELPETWGLIECNPKSTKIVKKAPELDVRALDTPMLCAIMRSANENMVSRVIHVKLQNEIESRVSEIVKERMNGVQETLGREAKHFRNMIQKFEDRAGIKIDEYHTWQNAAPADAVKYVINSGVLHAEAQVANLRKLASDIVLKIDVAERKSNANVS